MPAMCRVRSHRVQLQKLLLLLMLLTFLLLTCSYFDARSSQATTRPSCADGGWHTRPEHLCPICNRAHFEFCQLLRRLHHLALQPLTLAACRCDLRHSCFSIMAPPPPAKPNASRESPFTWFPCLVLPVSVATWAQRILAVQQNLCILSS